VGALLGALVAARFETALACIAAGLVGAWQAGARRPPGRWAWTLATGVATAIALNVVLVHGRPLFAAAAWAGTREGLAAGALLALRLVGAAVAVHGLRFAWPGEQAADEVAGRLRVLERLKLPIRATRAVVGLALRFAPLVADEASRIAALQDHRAGGPPRSRAQWAARRRALVVPLLVCTLERAERVALGMEARHYRVRPVGRVTRSWVGEACGVAVATVALAWRG
jgi:energy-coupling factor transporter transmembrane protein EcfT